MAIFLLGILAIGCQTPANSNEGQQLYTQHCANCHGPEGKGFEALYPPLAKADMLQASGAGAACWIRKGLSGKIQVNGKEFENAMPPNPLLTETEITNILNYIHNSWGNTHKFITLEEVNKALENCP